MAKLETDELKLIELLPLGNQQPRPAKNLAIMLGVDTRHVRLLVNTPQPAITGLPASKNACWQWRRYRPKLTR